MQVAQVSKTLGCDHNFTSIRKKDLHSDDLSLIQDSITHWNLSYYMVECIIKLQQPLFSALIEV